MEHKDSNILTPLFEESGGHRWQEKSPIRNKSGKIHTSTVTVAVFESVEITGYKLLDKDIDITTTKDSGKGGQHRNKTESAVIMTHLPTGITAKVAERSQYQNKIDARNILESRVQEFYRTNSVTQINNDRKKQIGSGMRGDKIKTYRYQDDIVIVHANETKLRLSKVLKGLI